MSDQKIKKPIVIDKFFGMYTSLPSYLIPDFYVASSLNMSYVSIGYTNPFELYSLFLKHTVKGSFLSSETFTRPDGIEIPLILLDTGSKCVLYWYNAVAKQLEILVDDLTTGKRMAFSGKGYNTTTSDGIFFCNGIDEYTFWNGAHGTIKSNTATVITLNEASAATQGFDATGGTIRYKGTDYTYSGVSGATLTGLSALPTLVADTGIAEIPDITTGNTGGALFDIMWVQDGRIWGARTDGILVYYSKVGDGTLFTAGDNPDDAGSFDIIEGTGPITAGAAFKDYSVIYKKDLAKYYQLVYPTNSTKTRNTDIIRQGDDLGCAGPDAILSLDDRVYYTSPKGGIRWIGKSESNDGFTFDDFTNVIRPTLKDGIFTGCHMFYFERERVLVSTYKKDSDSSKEDRQITVEFTEDDALVQARPININDWPMNVFFKYSGEWYGCSNLEKEIYKLFDGYTKNGAPALTSVTLKRYSFGNKFTRKRIDYIGVPGRIASGCLLHFSLSYNQDGVLKFLEATLEYNEGKFITQGNINVIGQNEIGTNPIGGNLDDIEELDPFLVFFWMPRNVFPYNVELTIYCEGVDSTGRVTGNRYTIEPIAFYVEEENLNIDKYRVKNFNEVNINDLAGGFGSLISPLSELSPLGAAGTDFVRIGADTDGSWRFIINGVNLDLDKKENGVWNTKAIYTP